MGTRPFTHLHCHTHYSLLDGASSIPKLVSRAKEHGFNSLAITDYGNCMAYSFIRNVIRTTSIQSSDMKFISLWGAVLENPVVFATPTIISRRCSKSNGLQNLVKWSMRILGFHEAQTDKQHWKTMARIICPSGCVSSEFNQVISRLQISEFRQSNRSAEMVRVTIWRPIFHRSHE